MKTTLNSFARYSPLAAAVLMACSSTVAQAKEAPPTGVVHGRQIEVQGTPVISGSPYVQQQLSVTTLPTATDADSTDRHSDWRYVWQVAGTDIASEQNAGSVSTIPPFTVRADDRDKAVKVCLKAVASSGFPADTRVSTVACSNEVTILDSAPVANNVTISGTLAMGQTLTGNYQFADADGDTESGTTFQWFRADDAAGTINKTPVGSANTYMLVNADRGKYMVFEVTPKSASGSASTGTLARSVSSQIPTALGMIDNFSAPDGQLRNWNDAVSYCNNLVQHGYSDWRLPSRDELVSLVNSWPSDQISLVHGWPTDDYYWSSPLYSSGGHYVVGLHHGFVGVSNDNNTFYVTCVR
ncbi:MAG: DUF1566 domain-containing protein [Aeromonadaceae bacterium]